MCIGSRKPSPPSSSMSLMDAGAVAEKVSLLSPAEVESSILLEFAADDDVAAFKQAVEGGGVPIDASAPWYARSVGPAFSPARRMGYAHRTPAMIAALYGSTGVLNYILGRSSSADVNRRCGPDSATALHYASSGGSSASLDVVRLLINASADVDAVDASGNRPGDVIAKQFSASMARDLEVLLKAPCPRISSPSKELEAKSSGEKKEYPPDLTLPDIKNGIYGTDEFRMYTFKVKPCSRAYSHDWTECPFVHPGENARRRDPRKYSYSCVPCPDFRKGSCLKSDACEYAHGVFECWLHPAQYRTRLCKDETGCNRRVCFFAHKVEELRMVNPTTASVSGHVLSSPRSPGLGVSSLDMMAALMMPMSPSASSSAMGSPSAWMNSSSSMVPPPALQLPSSRLKSNLRARDLEFDLELLGLEGYQQKLLDEISSTASPRSNWNNSSNTASDYTDLFGSLDPSMLSQLQALSLKNSSGYGNSISSSPTVTSSSSFGLDHSMAKAIMNSRQAAFTKRSQSFIDRVSAPRYPPGISVPFTSTQPSSPLAISDWASPDGKLDWGIQGDELSKLRKSSTFNLRSNGNKVFGGLGSPGKVTPMEDSDLSWGPAAAGLSSPKVLPPIGRIGLEHQKQQYQRTVNSSNGGAGDFLSWDQLYAEPEQMQMVA